MSNFQFGTKAETLERLKPLLKEAIILDQLAFSIKNWNNFKDKIINKIQSFFDSDFLIIRSSAKNEDSYNYSMAGNYESILNVKKNNREDIINAIEIVKNSYLKDHEINEEDQIFVQPMLMDVDLCGVIFTRCPNTGAPYIIVNYEDFSGKTFFVTAGNSSTLKTFTFFKNSENFPSNLSLLKLINISRQIENITESDCLDIEFAIKNNQIYILQVRILSILKKINEKLDKDLIKSIKNIKKFVRDNDKKFPNLFGYKAIFGSMPDWNPAEIIGESPKPLAFSLYKELITDYIWPLSRKKVGYKDVGYHEGVVSLGGKPYVDVRLSFNTFIPSKLSDTVSEKLVNFYIDKLINNPEMHDKIEFKIAYTCYNFGFEENEKELIQNNFSILQIKEIKEALKELTEDIILEKFTSIDSELELNNLLEIRRKKIIESDINDDVKIVQLIHDCKYYGTLPFSKIARFAFIGNILLSSFVNCGIINEIEKNLLFRSINSITTDFLKKLDFLKEKKINKEDFLKEFGHLRPGTYDLCSKTYNECFDEYFNLEDVSKNFFEEINFDLSIDKKKKIQEIIEKEGFKFNVDQFLNFVKKALAAREKSKLEFSKNLSLILDYCYNHFKKYGFTKEDITFLEIKDILSFSHKSRSINEIDSIKEKIKKNKKEYEITKSLRLPPLIYLERNMEYFHQFDNKPNYITNKSIFGEVIYLNEKIDPKQINGKIVLIKNADPGYDWIFGHNIKGLITKYGGVGSHMSIRCAEFDLPASIGCGETIFEYIKKFKKIELNCSTKQIKGIL